MVELDKNVVFIRENQPVDTVHIIVRGMFKITDYRVYGIAYDFMQFDGINAMGGMELIMDLDTYQATLQTITPCTSIAFRRCLCKVASHRYPCAEAGSQDHGTLSV